MGVPTARIGDLCSHPGMVCVTGSGDVITNNRRTHRMTDIRVCPIHGASVTIAATSRTVITNNLQTAKIGSLSLCLNMIPTVIVTGSPDTNVP